MTPTVASLLKYTTDAREPMALGIGYSAADNSAGWGVISEKKNDRLTGRIGVICDNADIRRAFVNEARRLGHTVDVPLLRRPKNTVFVTLRH